MGSGQNSVQPGIIGCRVNIKTLTKGPTNDVYCADIQFAGSEPYESLKIRHLHYPNFLQVKLPLNSIKWDICNIPIVRQNYMRYS